MLSGDVDVLYWRSLLDRRGEIDRQPAVLKAWLGTRLDYSVGHVARSPVHLGELRRSGVLRFVALLPEHPAYFEQQGESAGALSLARHLVTVSPGDHVEAQAYA